MNRKDLRALTLVGPTRNNPELDLLAVLHLINRLCMMAEIQTLEGGKKMSLH